MHMHEGYFRLIDSEVTALKDLYDATEGEDWEVNVNWLDGDPCENKWFGVNYYSIGACDKDNLHVEELVLPWNGLKGALNKPLKQKHVAKCLC